MLYNIKKNSVSNFPTPCINCNVVCFLTEVEMQDEQNAVYWLPFQIPLNECIGMTPEGIDDKIMAKGNELFNRPEMQVIFDSIELGRNVIAPEVIG